MPNTRFVEGDIPTETRTGFVAEAAIVFGSAVERGTDPLNQVKTLVSGAFFGIALEDPGAGAVTAGQFGAATQYDAKEEVKIARKGIVGLVPVAAPVTAGKKLAVVNLVGDSAFALGDLVDETTAIGTTGTSVTIAGTEFQSTLAAAGNATLQLNLPA